MWDDARFRTLSAPPPNAQTEWIYLLTGHHTGPIPGLFRAGAAGLAEGLRWPIDAFLQCFEELAAHGMVEADWAAPLVFLPNAVNHNAPDSPNVVISWARSLDDLPECPLKARAVESIGTFLDAMGPAWGAAWRNPPTRMPHPRRSSEEMADTLRPKPAAKAKRVPKDPRVAEVLEYLNRRTGRHYEPVEANVRLILARLAEPGRTVDQLKAVVDAKVTEWARDPKMANFLRPATLFSAENFAQYIGGLAPGQAEPKPETPEEAAKRRRYLLTGEG